jgi:2,3-bisphosphoglycerate-dependent phosphoglycerate mutase
VTRLIFVRHGESNTAVARVIGGYRTCNGLSALGRAQAERLRDRWTTTPEFTVAALIASNFRRAEETAEIIAPAFDNMPIEVIDAFGEHDPGEDCDGLPYDDFIERYGRLDWESDPFRIGFPGGETLAEFHLRVGHAISGLIRRFPDETVVICSHGGVIDAALRQALRAPPVGAFDISTVNTSITDLELAQPGRWRLQRYNDHAHLAGLEIETPRGK